MKTLSEKSSLRNLESLAELALEMGAAQAKIIDAKSIVVGDWVRLKCQYGCGRYGRCLTCPPFSPAPEQTRKILADYSKAILIQVRDESILAHDLIVKLEREAFLCGYYSAFGMISGPCVRCDICSISKCSHPRLARPSLEASGIDVYNTVRKNGFEIRVLGNRSDIPRYFELLLVH